jgi:hypothetical protein
MGGLHHLIADRAPAILSQDSIRSLVPHWDGQQWTVGTQ